ncbi:MAG: aminotransferase class III-fold pyridoxal phosphate-dependent enzyme [Nitrososphaerota archaeon]
MKSDLPKITRPPASGDAARIISRDIKLMARACRRKFPIAVKKIEGSIVLDVNDNAYIDFTSGFGALPLGGQHPEIIKAIRTRAESSMSIPPALYYEEAVELAEELARIAPIRGGVRIFFCDSISEAIDAAARAARWHSGKSVILAFTGGYHGPMGEALVLSASSRLRRPPMKIVDVVYGVGRNCAECPISLEPERCRGECLKLSREIVEAVAPDDLAAIVFEPMGLETPTPPPVSYMEALEGLARDFGGLLVANERATAPARAGRWFALDRWNFKADIVCLGEQLASGLPLGALIARDEILDMEPSEHDFCCGNALSISAALATLRVIRDEGLVERGERIGRTLLKRVREMAGELGWMAHGLGMLVGIWPPRRSAGAGEREAKIIVDECFRAGLLLWRISSTIIIAPALNMEEEILEKGLEILGEKIGEVSRLSRASSA